MRRPQTQKKTRPSVETLEDRTVPTVYHNLLALTPNDTYYSSQWGNAKVSAPSAWDVTTGAAPTVVASIDTGVDYTHPDLYLNIWLNQGELPTAVKDAFAAFGSTKDVGGDGLITFRDLNQKNSDGSWLYGNYVSDSNGNGYIDAGDILRPAAQGGWDNGVDDDGNGYVDDFVGWNYVADNNMPLDDYGHGTHTAGIIGAQGNNKLGVAGIDWNVQIMAIKFITKDNTGDLADAESALHYSADNGAKVSNNSWGVWGLSSASQDYKDLYAAVQYAGSKGQLVVVAAGNNGLNNDTSFYRSYPASFNLSNIISVAATASNDALASWSNYGRTSVDLAAPGVNVLSTLPGGQYGYASGTSMATPFVTGAAALILSRNPGLSATDVKNLILNNVDKVNGLSNKLLTGGRLNVSKAIKATPASSGGASGASGSSSSGGNTGGQSGNSGAKGSSIDSPFLTPAPVLVDPNNSGTPAPIDNQSGISQPITWRQRHRRRLFRLAQALLSHRRLGS